MPPIGCRHKNSLILGALFLLFALALWPSSVVQANSYATPIPTKITITQWLDYPANPGARQSNQTTYGTLWYVTIAVTTLDGAEFYKVGAGDLTWSYNGIAFGTTPVPVGPLIATPSPDHAGNNVIQAHYTGSSAYAASSAEAIHVVTKANVRLSIDTSASTSSYSPGAPLILGVQANVSIPSGEDLNFFIDGSLIYTYPIPSGEFIYFFINIPTSTYPPVPIKAPMTAGHYMLSVAFSGDANIVGGTSPGYPITVTSTNIATATPTTTGSTITPTNTPTSTTQPGTPTPTPTPLATVNATPTPIPVLSGTTPNSSQSRTPWGLIGFISIIGVGGLGILWRTRFKRNL